jgi:hypothetical protein
MQKWEHAAWHGAQPSYSRGLRAPKELDLA